MKSKTKKRAKKVFSITLLFLLCACMICGLAGCSVFQKEEEKPALNANRGTDYDYDFVQYLDAKLYGSNGYGFLDIKPKDISVSDFKDEKEYIAVKKALDTLNLYIDPNKPDRATNLVADKSNKLSNGDIVTLSISDSVDASQLGIKINLEPYQFEVKDLPEPKKLDIFDNSSVDFVGLDDGSNTIYPIKIYGGAVPDDLLDVIDYTATTQDSTLEAGKTIIDVTAELHEPEDDDEETIDKDGTDYSELTLETYLGMKGYVSETTGEKVVRELGKQIDFDKESQKDIQSKLAKVLKASDSHFLNVANIQQKTGDDTTKENSYDYMVTYYSDYQDKSETRQDGSACFAAGVKMANTTSSGVSVLELTSSGSRTSLSACTDGYDGYTVKKTFGTDQYSAPAVIEPTATPDIPKDDTTDSQEASISPESSQSTEQQDSLSADTSNTTEQTEIAGSPQS